MTRTRRGVTLILVAAFLSFVLSVVLWFASDRQYGIFVGLWVPSILSAGCFWAIATDKRPWTAVNILLAVLGSGITLMVGAGMILLTPGGAEDHAETPDLAHPEPRDADVGPESA